MNTETEFQYPNVRQLTRKDRRKLSELIEAFADRSGNKKLTEMIPGVKKAKAKTGADAKEETEADDTTERAYELIKSVMQGLLQWVEDDVTTWFMDLIGVTDRDKYDNMPFDIEVHIIDSLINQKGFNNFFMKASALYKKIRG